MLSILDVESTVPDDRRYWEGEHPGAHSDTPDGRMLAVVAARVNDLPGKFSEVMTKIDNIHETAKELFDTLSEEIKLQGARITALERDRDRMYAYLIAAGAFATFLSPLMQSALKSWLHLP